ncbi:hypothetical protein H9P43_001015 [Blastocladiella emersonii ATCC 22665]|nr:hypothetical protein H9P43_001015 [Blastocladiella emersonii ATCC 22665]
MNQSDPTRPRAWRPSRVLFRDVAASPPVSLPEFHAYARAHAARASHELQGILANVWWAYERPELEPAIDAVIASANPDAPMWKLPEERRWPFIPPPAAGDPLADPAAEDWPGRHDRDPGWYLRESALFHHLQQQRAESAQRRSADFPVRKPLPAALVLSEAPSTLQQQLDTITVMREASGLRSAQDDTFELAPMPLMPEINAATPPEESGERGTHERLPATSMAPQGFNVNGVPKTILTAHLPPFPAYRDLSVVTISLHDPVHPQRRLREIEVLSTQPFSVLRDHLFCPADYTSPHERQAGANNPEAGKPKTSPSALVVDGRILVDGRAGYRLLDVAGPIMQWYTARNLPLERLPMESTPLDAVPLRINEPYVLVHQGACEHLVIVQNIRLWNPVADPPETSYPRTTFKRHTRRQRCTVCDYRAARYVTRGDRHAVANPCRWCAECYTAFHYARDGVTLLYDDFVVHEIVHEIG